LSEWAQIKQIKMGGADVITGSNGRIDGQLEPRRQIGLYRCLARRSGRWSTTDSLRFRHCSPRQFTGSQFLVD